jgi:hypothetical protein
MIDLQEWADGQIGMLIGLGTDVADAEASVKWVLDNLPAGMHPDKWVPTARQLEQRIDDSDIHDARVVWYASNSVPVEYKRLLDARGNDDGQERPRGASIQFKRATGN